MTALSLDDLSGIEKEIVDLAVDDYEGLYEIIWRLNVIAAEQPDKVGIARSAVRRLVRDGWLTVVMSNSVTNTAQTVLDSQVDALLGDPLSWATPAADARPCVVGTAEAEHAYGRR